MTQIQTEGLRSRAKKMIECDHQDVYDVCADTGQIFDNVKGMAWLVEAVMDWIDPDWRLT